mmetsp:Transcript_11619/g.20411  ORF Transcript_11619/g.20411 Transcript_11619/m.20411 type:complete len:606 (-) Transcript_11619:194-2011(-)|eukprot:CAMPEP_0201884278 /NCGR_PEP_ID=MMETSP0902-20130614/16858_1 /ASSEMBLY_ACC=CAM_ASM_000551 /TAXON_ID=420261 /ORGANISM="Thalassiosira antarctica, Strain CCMP982" /LENGTH=605 /DNA_ID=CAMNT_0048413211 /DNA_START=209 /DNA_END=2026 /DNA_ORIENTATION=+
MKTLALFLPFAILPHDGVHSFVFPVTPNGLNSLKNSAPLSVATSNSREIEATNSAIDIDYSSMTTLPRLANNEDANEILSQTEQSLRSMQESVLFAAAADDEANEVEGAEDVENDENPIDFERESVYANSYVDLGQVDTVGFDYDYTLVTYTKELLKVIYDMALKRLVEEKDYPDEMLTSGLKFDPFFSIRGLAVDRENGWICHLAYTHKVAVAWEGRHRVSRPRLMDEYSGKRALSPSERKRRLKPLNDLFSMAECCLMADTVQFFLDRDIPFCPRSAVNDVLGSITGTHISGEFHKLVAREPEKYFEEKPYLKEVLDRLKESGKRLIFVSNSPFWYCDAGMNYVVGPGWRDKWDVVITSAGKPSFYTEDNRPFREVDISTGKVKFKQVVKLDKGRVYTSGCLKELTKCINWRRPLSFSQDENDSPYDDIYSPLTSPTIMYVGDSLFADLVDAKREFGWTTAAVTPEIGWEIELQRKTEFVIAERAIEILLNSLRLYQRSLGTGLRSKDELEVMDKMERIVSSWRDEQTRLLGNPFGSVFRARYTPSLFAHSLRRYCDLYMSNVGSLRHYSPQHRFYPESPKLLSHEIRGSNPECCDVDLTSKA